MKLTEKIKDVLESKEAKDIKQKIRQLKSYEDGVKLSKEIDGLVDSGKLSHKEGSMLMKSIDMKTAKDY